jgi:hypothetical protein
MPDLAKVADVLEKAAALLDSHEAERTRVEKQAHEATVKGLTEKYAAATGEELPCEVAEKLALGDPSVLKTVEAVIEKTAGPVESLGRSGVHADGSPHRTTKAERAQAAWDRLGHFINS